MTFQQPRLLFEYSANSCDWNHFAISKGGETALHCEADSGVLRAWRTSDVNLQYTPNVLRPPVVDFEETGDKSKGSQPDRDWRGDFVRSVLLSDDAATLYVGTSEGKIHVFDTQLGKVVDCMHAKNFVKSPVDVSSMALVECKGHGDGAPPALHLFSAHRGGAIARWSVEKPRTLLAVYGAAAVPGARRAEGGLYCMAVRSGAAAEPGTLGGGGDGRGACGVARIEIVTGYVSGNLARWTVEERVADPKKRGREIVVAEEAQRDSGEVRCTACSRDGVFVVCGTSSGRISLRRTDGRGVIWTSTSRCNGGVGCIDISNGNKLVAACTGWNTDVLVLDGDSGAEIRRLSGHECYVRLVIFTRDGKYLASVDANGGVFLWDMGFCNSPLKLRSSVRGSVDVLATAAASETGSGEGLDILVAVNRSGECWVWSLIDLQLLFNEPLQCMDGSGSVRDHVIYSLQKSRGWHLKDWRERRGSNSVSGWTSHQVGQRSLTMGRIMKIAKGYFHDLGVAGPTAMSGNLLASLCSCCRSHLRFDSDFYGQSAFACNSAAPGTSPHARVDSESAIDSSSNSPSVGHVLLGCGLHDGKLATFQLMESSEPDRQPGNGEN